MHPVKNCIIYCLLTFHTDPDGMGNIREILLYIIVNINIDNYRVTVILRIITDIILTVKWLSSHIYSIQRE